MSHPRRFLCPTDLGSPPWTLDPRESRHALKVLRLRQGDGITLMDGRGGTRAARVSGSCEGSLVLDAAGPPDLEAPPKARPHLLLGAPEPKVLDEVAEHAVELGAWSLLVAVGERSEVRPEALVRRRERLESLVGGAGKQSGNPYFPRVLLFASVEEALADLPRRGFLLAQEAPPLGGSDRADLSGDFALAVGPEGDFSEAERALLAAHGLRPASLGSRTLRVATAALAALAVAGSRALPG